MALKLVSGNGAVIAYTELIKLLAVMRLTYCIMLVVLFLLTPQVTDKSSVMRE